MPEPRPWSSPSPAIEIIKVGAFLFSSFVFWEPHIGFAHRCLLIVVFITFFPVLAPFSNFPFRLSYISSRLFFLLGNNPRPQFLCELVRMPPSHLLKNDWSPPLSCSYFWILGFQELIYLIIVKFRFCANQTSSLILERISLASLPRTSQSRVATIFAKCFTFYQSNDNTISRHSHLITSTHSVKRTHCGKFWCKYFT